MLQGVRNPTRKVYFKPIKNQNKLMNNQNLQWTTLHTDTCMTHDFGNGFKIIVNKTTDTAYKMNGNDAKESFSTKGILLETYEQILINFAKSIQ